MHRKPDAAAIGAFFDELSQQPWLGRQRVFWPRFCFHVTDARNAASILQNARLYSRDLAQSRGLLQNDNASSEIISQTQRHITGLVRLYFRPRTATFARSEGLRPLSARYGGAHCPVPVALMFDISEIAGLHDAEFSDGNLASHETRTGNSYAFLQGLDFRAVYHNAPLQEHEQHIRRVHQAEIVVPNELPLGALRHIVVRSAADRLTLRTLLWDTGTSVPPGVEVRIDHSMFFCRWSHLRRVVLNGERVIAHFDPDPRFPGEFTFRWEWRSALSDDPITETETLEATGIIVRPLPAAMHGRPVRLHLYLDDALAFTGVLRPTPSMVLLG